MIKRWVELCGATAVIGQALMTGIEVPIIPMQGGKTGYLRPILESVNLKPGDGAEHLLINEPAMYGQFWQSVVDQQLRPLLIERLETLSAIDPLKLWTQQAHQPIPDSSFEATLAWSVLQFWGYARKPVYPTQRRPEGQESLFGGPLWWWKTHGFNRTIAYNGEYREKRGEGIGRRDQRLPDIVARLKALPTLDRVTVTRHSAELLPPQIWGGLGVVCLIDPPYAGTTDYGPYTLSRAQVLLIARAWALTGATVIVCEAAPLADLLGAGWHSMKLPPPRGRGRNNYGATEEWLTVYRGE